MTHGFCTQYVTGHGRLEVTESDPRTLSIEGVTADRPLIKYEPVGRTLFELSYAAAVRESLARRGRFDLVVACNLPLFTLGRLSRWFAQERQPWVLWHQDLHSLGVGSEAVRRLPGPLAGLAATRVQQLERAQVLAASGVVAITDATVQQYREWGIERENVKVIPNWAPIDDIVPGERDNAWAREAGLPDEPIRLMYAGTLGRKHNPMLLLEMLDATQRRGVDAVLVVASEGVGADDLRVAAAGRSDVHFVGFQPAERFAEMLACADVVVAILEPDAGRFSVPSKVHSYLSAGRPIVALMPIENPAAAEVRESGGFVSTPTILGTDRAAEWVARAAASPERLTAIGRKARRLAEEKFDIGVIGNEFEKFLQDLVPVGRRVRASTMPPMAAS